MSEPSLARVVHRSPGRLRVHLPSLTKAVHARVRRVEAADGVHAARLSERTANVLIEFDQALIDEPTLLALIDGRPADRSSRRGRPAPAADPPVESGWLWAQRTETIKAKPAACVAAIIGFERYPEWQAYIAAVEVLERDRRGRGVLVAARGEVRRREARFTVRYRFPSPNRVFFEQLDGELDAVRGGWWFRSVRGGRTRATYTLEVKPGRPRALMLRGALYQQVREGVLDHVMGELRRRVEPAAEPAARDGAASG